MSPISSRPVSVDETVRSQLLVHHLIPSCSRLVSSCCVRSSSCSYDLRKLTLLPVPFQEFVTAGKTFQELEESMLKGQSKPDRLFVPIVHVFPTKSTSVFLLRMLHFDCLFFSTIRAPGYLHRQGDSRVPCCQVRRHLLYLPLRYCFHQGCCGGCSSCVTDDNVSLLCCFSSSLFFLRAGTEWRATLCLRRYTRSHGKVSTRISLPASSLPQRRARLTSLAGFNSLKARNQIPSNRNNIEQQNYPVSAHGFFLLLLFGTSFPSSLPS